MVDNLAGADIVVGEEEPKDKPPPLAAPPQSVQAGDALVSGYNICFTACFIGGFAMLTWSYSCKFDSNSSNCFVQFEFCLLGLRSVEK